MGMVILKEIKLLALEQQYGHVLIFLVMQFNLSMYIYFTKNLLLFIIMIIFNC